MSNLKEFYKVDALKQEIDFLTKELKDLGQTHIGMHKNLETLQKKLTTAKEVVLNSATDMSKLHEENKELKETIKLWGGEDGLYTIVAMVEENKQLKKQLSDLKAINGTLKKQLEIKPKQAYESMEHRTFLAKPENQK